MKLAAALVHVVTALGAVCALLALQAALAGAWDGVFLWLGISFLIDGIDGTFARRFAVKERLPRFSGDQLDLVVDYLTYVFVPAVALLQAGILTGTGGTVLAALILLTSLYHFSDTKSKTADLAFVGFPAIWSIVAFYLFVFDASPATAAAVVMFCAALTFVPIKCVHPLRVVAMRSLTLAMTALWSAAAIWAVASGLTSVPAPAKAVLAVTALYFIGLTVFWYKLARGGG